MPSGYKDNITHKLQDYTIISTHIIGLVSEIQQNHWHLWATNFPLTWKYGNTNNSLRHHAVKSKSYLTSAASDVTIECFKQ